MFAYCNNNPVNSKDIAGGRPKDIQDDYLPIEVTVKANSVTESPRKTVFYNTPEEAAYAFGAKYYSTALNSECEYGTGIYQTNYAGKTQYYCGLVEDENCTLPNKILEKKTETNIDDTSYYESETVEENAIESV